MNTGFSVELGPWIAPREGPEEIRNTTAWTRMLVGGRVVTRVDDRWSQSARDQVVLAAYPLALWFASSWWRLLWEPYPRQGTPSISWRMTHESAAAGHGFVWPRLRFVSDGESAEVSSSVPPSDPSEPIRYLEVASTTSPLPEFEAALADFVDLVVRRLQVAGPRNSELAALWQEVQAERSDPSRTASRRIEARLGYDPDEAPEDLLASLEGLAKGAGQSGVEELAAALSVAPDPRGALVEVVEEARTGGVLGQLLSLPMVRPEVSQPPFRRGWNLAAQVRSALSLGNGPLTNDALGDLLGVTARHIKDDQPSKPLPLGLAVREAESTLRVVLSKRRVQGRRFEAARLFADAVAAPRREPWLSATDTDTARQKVQRAFAAEFLAPISALMERLQGDYSDESVDDAGSAFGVSPVLVFSQLANHGLISPDAVPAR